MKNFIYMVQGTSDRIGEYLHLRERPGADAVFLTYDREREGCIFFPNSTFMQGRNRMLAEARKLGDHRYFIFMDDDVEFVRGSYGDFESLLLQLRPAIGVPVFGRLRDSVIGLGSPFGRTRHSLLGILLQSVVGGGYHTVRGSEKFLCGWNSAIQSHRYQQQDSPRLSEDAAAARKSGTLDGSAIRRRMCCTGIS